MKMNKVISSVLILAILLFSRCSEENQISPDPKKAILMKYQWRCYLPESQTKNFLECTFETDNRFNVRGIGQVLQPPSILLPDLSRPRSIPRETILAYFLSYFNGQGEIFVPSSQIGNYSLVMFH